MSYTMLPYNSVRKSRKSYISWYTQYISRYTIGQKYISVYTEIFFWPIVYVEIYYYTCNSVYVRTAHMILVWNSQIKYLLACTEYMPVYTFTADFLSWMRGHILVHTLTSEHISCATAFFPACALLARLHPAGPPAPCGREAHSKAAHSLQQQDTLGQEQISVLFCQQLQGSPKAASSSAVAEPLAALAAPASGSELDSYVVWATNLHLNVVARGRASEIAWDRLYPPPWGCLDRQEQRLFRYGRECDVMTLKSLHKSKQL
jgi:hypothetical protein